jgi:hypothetical protein
MTINFTFHTHDNETSYDFDSYRKCLAKALSIKSVVYLTAFTLDEPRKAKTTLVLKESAIEIYKKRLLEKLQ